MAGSISTRALGGNDNVDRRSVRVDGQNYKDKSGIIEVVLTSYTTSGTGTLGGNVDLRPAGYNADNDEIYLNNVAIGAAPATVSITKKFYVAVNNGVPGPNATVNPDGTWDLLILTYVQAPNNAQVNTIVQFNYTLTAFLDLTATVNPADTGSLPLVVDGSRIQDEFVIALAASTIAAQNGRIRATLNWLQNEVIDQSPAQAAIPVAGVANDPAPYFSVLNAKTPSNVTTGQGVLTQHQLAKISGVKTYYQCHMIFAVNNGKVDGNGSNLLMSVASQVALFNVTLYKAVPTDDIVTATVAYSAVFTAM